MNRRKSRPDTTRSGTPPPNNREKARRRGRAGAWRRAPPSRQRLDGTGRWRRGRGGRPQAAFVAQPARQGGDAVPPRDRGPQAKLPRGQARVGDVVALVAGPPVRIDGFDRAAGLVFNGGDHLPETDRIGGAAAGVEGASLDGVDAPPRRHVSRDGVRYVEHVAHLEAVAVDADRLALQRPDQEVRHPAL